MAVKIVTVSNQVTVSLGQFAVALQNKEELLKVIGAGQLLSIYKNFDESGAPSAPWPPLSEASKRWGKHTPGHKLLMLSGRTRNSIKSVVEGNSVVIGTGYRIAVIQFLGFDGTQSVRPYSYSRRAKSRDKYANFSITNKAGRKQTVRRKTVSGVTTVNVKGFSRHIRIPARNPLVFRPEDPARIHDEVSIWAAQRAKAAGLETKLMPASMVLPGDVEQSLLSVMTTALAEPADNFPAGIAVGAIGEKDIGDNDELVLQMPCARQRYAGTAYKASNDNQWLTYDVSHIFEIWCAAEDLTSKEAQRTATMAVLALVLPLVAGARLRLIDGSVTEPVAVKNIGKLPDDIVGTIYILTIEICGIAQFPGTLAAGNEDE